MSANNSQWKGVVGNKWNNVGVVEDKPDESANRRRVGSSSPFTSTDTCYWTFRLFFHSQLFNLLSRYICNPQYTDFYTLSHGATCQDLPAPYKLFLSISPP